MDLVYPRALAGDLVSTWEQPLLLRHIQALASFSRVLLFDERGRAAPTASGSHRPRGPDGRRPDE